MKRKEEVNLEWTKREKTDFFRYIVNNGVPLGNSEDPEDMSHWQVVREKAKLGRKTLLNIRDYYVDTLKLCKKMTESADLKKDGKKETKKTDEKEKEDDSTLTIQKCKKFIERTMLFKKCSNSIISQEIRSKNCSNEQNNNTSRLVGVSKIRQRFAGGC